MIQLGGHAINVVGYSESYRDEWGNTGGFILRNSWSDGLGTAHGSKGRGSHSAAYFMRDVFDFDESLVCPNPHSPRSWQLCKSVDECESPLMRVQANVARKSLALTCTDNSDSVFGVCTPKATYYLANLTEWDSDGLFVGCFFRADRSEYTCLPPLLIDDLATVFTPLTIDHINDPTICGYNFLPFATLEAIRSRFGGTVAGDFTIEWARSSYVSQRSVGQAEGDASLSVASANLDYSLLERSTQPMPKLEKQAGALWVR